MLLIVMDQCIAVYSHASSKNLSVVAMSASGLHVFMATATALLSVVLVERL